MTLLLQQLPPADCPASACGDDDLCARVRAEFRDMPGLRLTIPQAARLFSIDPGRCERVLGALVDSGHLATDGLVFARSDRPWIRREV